MHPATIYSATADPHTFMTFRALVEAIIPGSPVFCVGGAVQAAGAADLCIHEYMIWELDHSLSLVLGFRGSGADYPAHDLSCPDR